MGMVSVLAAVRGCRDSKSNGRPAWCWNPVVLEESEKPRCQQALRMLVWTSGGSKKRASSFTVCQTHLRRGDLDSGIPHRVSCAAKARQQGNSDTFGMSKEQNSERELEI